MTNPTKPTLSGRLADWRRTLAASAALPGVVEVLLPRGWPEADPAVYWWMRTNDGAEPNAGREENLAQLATKVRGPIHLWTPPGDTLLTRAKLPTRSRARILQALPYALEDQLLDEPENLQFAYVREADGQLAVAVTQRARINNWLEIFKSTNLRLASACPANLALPLYAQAWTAAFVNNELWVRTGEHAGFVCLATSEPPALLLTAMKEAASQIAGPQRLVVFSPPGDFVAEQWSAQLHVPVSVEAGDFWRHARIPALNLLQSDYGQAAHLRQIAKPLRPAAVMLAVWIVAMWGMDFAEWVKLRRQYNASTAEMRAIFQQNFPHVKTLVDPAAQMQRELEILQSRGGGPADMLPLLTRIAPALQSAQGRAKLNGVKYSERTLTIELSLPDYQALDAVKNSLQAANLDVEVVAANSRGDEVDGRLRIQPAGMKGRSRQRS